MRTLTRSVHPSKDIQSIDIMSGIKVAGQRGVRSGLFSGQPVLMEHPASWVLPESGRCASKICAYGLKTRH